MIVVSLPRAGGTKICMDLAGKNNLKFLGELIPRNVMPVDTLRYRKDLLHETKYEIQITEEEYCAAINGDRSYISLVNSMGSNLTVADADYVVLRKNLKNCVYSWINYNYKASSIIGKRYPSAIFKVWIQMLLEYAYGIIVYCTHNKKNIIWYEDYFPDVKTEYNIPNSVKVDIDNEFKQYTFIFSALDNLIAKETL